MSKLSAVRRLLSGSALSSPPEDDEHDDGPAANDAGTGKGDTKVSAAQLEAAAAADVKAAEASATAAANARWNTVMTSDAGVANPKAAARLLNTTSMSADDVVATLGDIAPAAAAPKDDKQAAEPSDRERLANDDTARPDTGGAAAKDSVRKGEGESASANLRESRQARVARNNEAASKRGGKKANAE